jgi:alcohol dehydrogenase
MTISSFEFRSRTRLVVGPGTLDRLGELTEEFGGRRALVVSDPGVVAAGHTERGLESLRRRGIEAFLFHGVEENPTTRHVQAGVAVAKEHEVDFIIGLGGGSAMDCAKGVNFIVSCGGEMKDYWGVGKATAPLLPMIAVPTTAGTGSETQSFALIADETTHQKMACGDRRAACRAAILDPETTISLPAAVTAATGIDAIAHAVETFVTKNRNTISMALSRESWRLLVTNFECVLGNPDDIEARAGMQLGASLAGLAIENSMLGAAHSAANPLTAHFGVVHGGAVGLMLPHVVRFNADVMEDDYRDLLAAGPSGVSSSSLASNGGNVSAESLARRLEELRELSQLPGTLSGWNVDSSTLPQLAEEAASQWTAQFNPRNVNSGDFLELYRNAL